MTSPRWRVPDAECRAGTALSGCPSSLVPSTFIGVRSPRASAMQVERARCAHGGWRSVLQAQAPQDTTRGDRRARSSPPRAYVRVVSVAREFGAHFGDLV